MLSKLFRSRQSTASRQPPFQLGPTPDQPTDPKPPSKLARKLKEFKNALRPSRLTKKADNQAGHRSRGSHKSNPSDEVGLAAYEFFILVRLTVAPPPVELGQFSARANKWRQPLQRRHSSKQVHRSKKASEDEPILRHQTGEPTPVSTTTDGFKFHGRTLSSTSTGAAQAPLSPARLPLGTLNLSLVLGGEAQASLEAGAVEDSISEHGDISSQGTGVEDAITEASFWLGRIIFPRRQSPGPAQH
ncbi:hypothetical protein M407DRAFT_29596 [Tulasnella calospora MUT 4182]|uniref:Uncharacterized protein n=1 Tax=Tulasnella calospora MUT 4182 TaxID=1051891 RepID=A0A0C3Q9V3_9AGAM|nr:hypothetical protein M407DRAFT_29596 [Tulasnella calospora MUT 4182]